MREKYRNFKKIKVVKLKNPAKKSKINLLVKAAASSTTTTSGSTTTGNRPTGTSVMGGALSPIPSMEQVNTTTSGESGLQPLDKKKAMNLAIPALLVGGLLFAIYRYTR